MPRINGKGMGKKKLILLTNRFPFNPGEQFLETEILHLSKAFDEIHIIPINMTDNSNPRMVPENVIVHEVFLKKHNNLSKLFNYIIEILSDKFGLKWFLKDVKKAMSINPKCAVILFSWIGNALKVKKYIKSVLGSELEEYVFYSYWLSTSALALAMLKDEYPAIQAISRAHRGDLYEYTHNPHYLPLQKDIIKNINQVYVISEDGINYLHGKYGNEVEGKLSLERLGTLAVEGVAKPSKDAVLRIVTCSFISPVKRIPLLINALKQIENIKIEWRHIGDGVLRKQVEEMIEELPDNVNATILGSLDNKEVVKNYLQEPVDIFINISESEGVPVSIMEAFSCGIPVIATNVGGTRELVDNTNGILVDKDITPDQLEKEIMDFYYLDDNVKIQLRENALNMWNERFNAEKNYSHFSQLIQKD